MYLWFYGFLGFLGFFLIIEKYKGSLVDSSLSQNQRTKNKNNMKFLHYDSHIIILYDWKIGFLKKYITFYL